MNWFIANILNSILFGISSSVSKVPSKHNISGLVVMQWAFLVGTILGILFFIINGNFIVTGKLLLICAVWAITGVSSFLCTIELVKMSFLHSVVPLVTSISIVLSLLVGLFLFDDKFNFLQIFGIVLILINVFIWRNGLDFKKVKKALTLVLLASLLPAVNQLIRKVGVSSFDIESLQFFQYLFGFIFLSFLVWIRKEIIIKENKKYIYSYGSVMGLSSFLGSLLLFFALKNGPYGIVSLISFMSFIFVSLIGVFFFKEKFTKIHFMSLLLVIVGVVLVRLNV